MKFILIVLVLISFYSCGKSGSNDQLIKKVDQIELPSNDFTKEEIELSEKLINCHNVWISEKFNTKEEDVKFFGIGIIGKNCLKITNINVLLKVKDLFDSQTKNWKKSSREILKMEN